MGIKGIYQEIGSGKRIALSKLAVEHFEEHGRPLRLAIDTSIWLFQIQSGKGGTNPALRTFFYRLLRLISLSIHPLFIFDGPNKPPFKRNKRTGPNVASIPEYLAKQLLKQFGFPFHIAAGEAEAECALLQRRGTVDAVLSEDVDTLMFGSNVTIRNWSAEGTLATKTPTHVNVYKLEEARNGPAGLNCKGMILVALMSGGDYTPEGVPGVGAKTACEAARAGFGDSLLDLDRNDVEGLRSWKERLCHELKTNESGYFRSKHKALTIPEGFPRMDILEYYRRPALSSEATLRKLETSLRWDQDIDILGLRQFTAEAFDWTFLKGAKHFIRNMAPVLLVRQLRMRGTSNDTGSDDPEELALQEAELVKSIHNQRQHVSTDKTTEWRIGYIPNDLVQLNLEDEDPDPVLPGDESIAENDSGNEDEPSSPRKKRGPSQFDPAALSKMWMIDTFVKIGVPILAQDYEGSFRDAKKYEAMKAARKQAAKQKQTSKASRAANQRSLDSYAKTMKPGSSSRSIENANKQPTVQSTEVLDLSQKSPVKTTKKRSFKSQLPDTATINFKPGVTSATVEQQRKLDGFSRQESSHYMFAEVDLTASSPTHSPSSRARGASNSLFEHGVSTPSRPSKRRSISPLMNHKDDREELPTLELAMPRLMHDNRSAVSPNNTPHTKPVQSQEIITILSSPPCTPRGAKTTRNTTQFSITEFATRTPGSASSRREISACPASPTPKARAAGSKPKVDQVGSTHSKLEPPAFEIPVGLVEASRSKQAVRIRQSLTGSWAVNDASSVSRQNTGGSKSWKLDVIDVVDLS